MGDISAAISCLGGGTCLGKIAYGLYKFVNVRTVSYCDPKVDLPVWYQDRKYEMNNAYEQLINQS